MEKKASILIVDDLAANLKLLNEILTNSGYAVRPSDNGELAIASAFAEKPDLILLDVRMPVVDGFEVCRRLKAINSTANIPIIFISAYDELSDRLKGFELGAVDFIAKPFEPKEVLARIHTQLELSRLRIELAKQAEELSKAYIELQEKAEEVASQNEELMCQGEELRVQNEEYQSLNEELHQAEQNYREIFNATSDAVFIHDSVTGAILDVNDTMLKMFGFSDKNEIINISMNALSASDEGYTKEKALELMQKTVVSGNNTVEWKAKKKNGDLFWAEVSLKSTQIGGKGRILATVRDISERKLVEDKLRESETQFRLLFENINSLNGLYEVVLDKNGKPADYRYLQVNHAFEKFAGMKASELIGRTLLEVFPQTEQYWIEKLEEAYLTNTPVYFEKYSIEMNKYIALNIYLPQKGQLAMTSLDITERKLAEEKLFESEAQYRLLFDNIADTVFIHDLNLKILSANNTACKEYGYSKEEFLALSVDKIDVPRQNVNIKARVEELMQNGYTSFESEHKRKDGSFLFAEVNSKMVLFNGQNAVMSICRNITDRKLAELEILKAKEAAEAANKAKSEFLANMSHELRTPMNGIMGVAQLLDIALKNTPEYEFVELLSRSSKNMLRLVEDLLDLSRISAEKLKLSSIKMSLLELAENSVSTLKQKADEKKISLNYLVSDSVPSLVLGDPLRTQQILLNLLSNAIKFTEIGSVLLSIDAKKSNDKTDVIFTVKDTGVGIDKEIIPVIFERFVQGDMSYTKRFQGAGLGLTITEELVKLMGGTISVESELGKGSSFIVKIPFTVFADKQELTQIAHKNEAATKNKKFKMLLTEDSEDSLLFFQFLARDIYPNALLVIAKNGKEAIEKFAKEEFDIVFMDIQMPVMNGIEATEYIRNNFGDKGKSVPIIATTAYAMESDRELCIAAGMNDFVTKPLDITLLARLTDQYIGTKKI